MHRYSKTDGLHLEQPHEINRSNTIDGDKDGDNFRESEGWSQMNDNKSEHSLMNKLEAHSKFTNDDSMNEADQSIINETSRCEEEILSMLRLGPSDAEKSVSIGGRCIFTQQTL